MKKRIWAAIWIVAAIVATAVAFVKLSACSGSGLHIETDDGTTIIIDEWDTDPDDDEQPVPLHSGGD